MAEYIKREDLEFPYMTMTLWGLNKETCHAYNEGVKAAADYIASRPAANVVPVVHGRWEFDGSDWSDIWKCSACGDEWFFEYDPRDAETLVKFCPNCGAKMEADGNG